MPQIHFLRGLDGVVDWAVVAARLIRIYRGGAKRSRPPYHPVVTLKMLLLAYLYDLSERQTEAYVNNSLSAKGILWLAVDKPGPDHTSMTEFNEKVEKNGEDALLEELLPSHLDDPQER